MFRRLLPLLLCTLAGAVVAQPKLVAIANFGEHPALRAGIDGFKPRLSGKGWSRAGMWPSTTSTSTSTGR